MIPGTSRYQDRWKWFLPASRASLNPPGPSRKAKNLSFRTRQVPDKLANKSWYSLLTPFGGTPPGPKEKRIHSACFSAGLLAEGQFRRGQDLSDYKNHMILPLEMSNTEHEKHDIVVILRSAANSRIFYFFAENIGD